MVQEYAEIDETCGLNNLILITGMIGSRILALEEHSISPASEHRTLQISSNKFYLCSLMQAGGKDDKKLSQIVYHLTNRDRPQGRI